MPKNIIAAVLLLAFCVLNLCGCWDAKDVDKLNFPIAAAYDLHEDNPENMNQLSSGPLEEPQVDVTVLNPNSSLAARSRVMLETMPAATVGYARDKRAYTTPALYVTGFNKVILMGEALAEQGAYPYLESLYRFPSVSYTMVLAVVEGRAADILKTPVENYENMGIVLNDLLREHKANSFIPTATLHQFDYWQSPGNNPVLPLIKAGGVNGVFFSGLAVFNKDRMIGRLDLRQARTLSLLRGIKSQGFLPFMLEGEKEGTVFVHNDRQVKVEARGDSCRFKIKILLTGIIEEYPNRQLIDSSKLKKIEDSLAQNIKQDCEQFVQVMQEELQVDCIDVSKYALARWRKELKNVVDRPEFISNADIQVDVKVSLKDAGERR